MHHRRNCGLKFLCCVDSFMRIHIDLDPRSCVGSPKAKRNEIVEFLNIWEHFLPTIWDLFSQNERQVARELKEIWLIEHSKNQ